mgnify:CR=1 FL=1
MTAITNHVKKEYKELPYNTKVTQALSKLTSTKDIAIVTKDGEYEGIVSSEQLLRGDINAKESTIKKLYKKAPKIRKDDTVENTIKLLYGKDLKIAPVFDGETVIGTVHITDILQSLLRNNTSIKAEDLMTTNVRTVTPKTKLRHVIAALKEENVSRLPVTEDNQPVGIVTVYDITHNVFKPKERQKGSRSKGHYMGEKDSILDVEVNSIMQQNIETATPDTNIKKIIDTMTQKEIGSVIITNKNVLSGIITRKDIMRKVVQELEENKEEHVHIQLSSNIAYLDRQAILKQLKKFIQKYEKALGPGHISLHIKKHKEKLKGQHLLFGRLNVRTKNNNVNFQGEGYGQRQLVDNILRKLRTAILSGHQDKHQVSTAEYLEHFDITSL